MRKGYFSATTAMLRPGLTGASFTSLLIVHPREVIFCNGGLTGRVGCTEPG
jgi:hypothetical protein